MCKKYLSVFLAVLILLSCLPIAAFADDGDTVCGTFRYASGHDDYLSHDYESSFEYSDGYFTDSSYVYRHDLACASYALALASFSSIGAKTHDEHIRNFVSMMEQCGFGDISANECYGQTPDYYSVGVCAANKLIYDGGEPYTLITVGIRGANYLREWGGNGTMGAEGEHLGFAAARDKVLSFIVQYIAEQNISGNIKLWTAGYSRGGAIANMTGAALDLGHELGDGVYLSPENIYCYCFEAPRGAQRSDADDPVFKNIHNIINPDDMVTYCSFEDWDFVRYGTDHYLPTRTDADYEALKADMLVEFDKIENNGGRYLIDDFRYVGYSSHEITQPEFYAMLTDAMVNDFAVSRQDYADNLQTAFVEFLAIIPNYRDFDYSPVFYNLLQRLQQNAGRITDACRHSDKIAAMRVFFILEDIIVSGFADADITVFDASALNDALLTLAPRLTKLVIKHPDIALTLLNNATVIFSAHYTELQLAWMRSLPDDYLAGSTDSVGPFTPQRFDYSRAVFEISSKALSWFTALWRSLPLFRYN